MNLVRFGLDSAELAKRIKERGISFEPTEGYVESLKSAGATDAVVQALVRSSALGQEAGPPLSKDQITRLVRLGMTGADLAGRMKARGVDFEPTDDDLEALRKAGAPLEVLRAIREVKPKPLTQEQIGKLVAGGVPSQRAAALVKQHGIDFVADEEYLDTLRAAGATDEVIAALREASAAVWAELAVVTSPNADVYLDGALQGRANAQGELRVRSKPGAHALKISLKGKKDFEQSVTLAGLQAVQIEARLVDLGSIRVRTVAGAKISLDSTSRGGADAGGELVLADVSPGPHELQVSAPEKKDYRESVTVTPGQQTQIEVRLVDLPGNIRLQTAAGASVTLDSQSRGVTDASGQLVLTDVPPGAHQLGVWARGKRGYGQSVTVLAGQEAGIEARLESLPPPQVRENAKDGLKYVWIPPGTFMMGCSPGDSHCVDEEKPAHQVTISRGFWMGQTPVTVGAWKRFAGATGRHMPPTPDFNRGWKNENMPIVNVNWNDAQAYCGWIGGRLPTEAEWEYAARGGSTEVRYGPIDDIAWYSDNSGRQRLDGDRIFNQDGAANYWQRVKENGNGTHEVGQKRANGFGLYDMIGNVNEWVSDWYWDENYRRSSPSQDPRGPSSGHERVIRGASWDEFPWNVRVSKRDAGDPGFGINFRGFRCGGEAGMP